MGWEAAGFELLMCARAGKRAQLGAIFCPAPRRRASAPLNLHEVCILWLKPKLSRSPLLGQMAKDLAQRVAQQGRGSEH